jgi:hypothetical protein
MELRAMCMDDDCLKDEYIALYIWVREYLELYYKYKLTLNKSLNNSWFTDWLLIDILTDSWFILTYPLKGKADTEI